MTSSLRSIPSVDKLLQLPQAKAWIEEFSTALITDLIRESVAIERNAVKENRSDASADSVLARVGNELHMLSECSLRPVINATGVVLHTNLGRAPISSLSLELLGRVSQTYSTLEFDLANGKRGSRESHLNGILQRITGAEDAHICNNNAAAVLLILTALARRKPVIIARSQLVEIGGGFRVPEVMKQSGAKLIEVGTTNRVHLNDYEDALIEYPTAIVMHAHPSNFKTMGFTSEPPLQGVAALAHKHGSIFIDDLGSGALIDTAKYGLAHEPTVQESLAAGCDVVCFSGDKLLGGPQAGIIVGKRELVRRIAKHQLARALRADKLTISALFLTLLPYLKGTYEEEIPIWRMISQPLDELRERAKTWRTGISRGAVVEMRSAVGGGSLPGETMPTWALKINSSKPNELLSALRKGAYPVIGYIQDNAVFLDPRTVALTEDSLLITKCKQVLSQENFK